MSATRLLILGALRFMQPAHGYSIRRELESWNAETWANIAYGSIYFALNKMEQDGLVAVSDTAREGNRPARTTYIITESGEIEFQRLLREFWWEYKPLTDPFMVAVSFMDQLPPGELVAALRHHVAAARLYAESLQAQITSPIQNDFKPRHVVEMPRLMLSRLDAEVRWTEDIIAKIERGELP
ncbi:MAG TPA: PadR family transcriptional regulator [Thermomicrobiales bacterium]|jgi:DNA-binding PadR family transcriptional regulator